MFRDKEQLQKNKKKEVIQMFNKSEIMKAAWNYFKGIWTTQFLTEMDENFETITFSIALKEAWKVAKKDAIEAKELAEEVAKSEELKAWNWAEKKLGLVSTKSDWNKMKSVQDEYSNMWNNSSAFKAAMMAVKRAYASMPEEFQAA